MLFKKKEAIFIQDGHTQLLILKGKSEYLKNVVYHDDRKNLGRWLIAQNKYMDLEVIKLVNTPFKELSLNDKIRKQIIFAPILVLFYCYILKGGFLNGFRGLFYSFQRCFAELLLSLKLIENKFLMNK